MRDTGTASHHDQRGTDAQHEPERTGTETTALRCAPFEAASAPACGW
jgi:hypothetical protein